MAASWEFPCYSGHSVAGDILEELIVEDGKLLIPCVCTVLMSDSSHQHASELKVKSLEYLLCVVF